MNISAAMKVRAISVAHRVEVIDLAPVDRFQLADDCLKPLLACESSAARVLPGRVLGAAVAPAYGPSVRSISARALLGRFCLGSDARLLLSRRTSPLPARA